jgi:hypothetical protein
VNIGTKKVFHSGFFVIGLVHKLNTMNFLARRLPRTVATARAFSDAAPATAMTLNLSTPHENIYQGKTVDKVLLPGESGEYGVTVGHSPIISQLKPGVVSVIHTEVRTARRLRYFSLTGS